MSLLSTNLVKPSVGSVLEHADVGGGDLVKTFPQLFSVEYLLRYHDR